MAATSISSPVSGVKCSFSIENLLAKPTHATTLTVNDGQFVKLTRENIQKFNDFQSSYFINNNHSSENVTNNVESSRLCLENQSPSLVPRSNSPSELTVLSVENKKRQIDTITPESNFTDENFENSSDGGTDDPSKKVFQKFPSLFIMPCRVLLICCSSYLCPTY